MSVENLLVSNAKLLIGPMAVALEKWGAHTGSIVFSRGLAFAKGFESEEFQRSLPAIVKTEVDLDNYFGFKTGEQLLMRGVQGGLLLFAAIAENRKLPANWHLDKFPKPVKYGLEIARALYFASLVAAPVILDKMIKGEPVEPVSAGLVLGTAGAGLLYSGLRVMAANNIEARERRKQELHSGEIDLKVKDESWNRITGEDTRNRVAIIKQASDQFNKHVEAEAGKNEKERKLVNLRFSYGKEVPISDRQLVSAKPKWQLDLRRRFSWSAEENKRH